MPAVEGPGNDARTEGPRWIQRAASVIYANKLGDEERQTNAHRCDERCFMLFFCKQKDLE